MTTAAAAAVAVRCGLWGGGGWNNIIHPLTRFIGAAAYPCTVYTYIIYKTNASIIFFFLLPYNIYCGYIYIRNDQYSWRFYNSSREIIITSHKTVQSFCSRDRIHKHIYNIKCIYILYWRRGVPIYNIIIMVCARVDQVVLSVKQY